ncbi:MAG: hypothetical protein Fur0011_4500 [Candidatus Microgenomates bacterium]
MNDPFKNFKPLNDTKPKQKAPNVRSDGFAENMRDMGSSVVKSLKNDVIKGTAESIFNQILGTSKNQSIPETKSPLDQTKLEQIIAEREAAAYEAGRAENASQHISSLKENQVIFSFADEKLKQEINSIRSELAVLVKTMGKVEKQVELAIMDNVTQTGVYHLNYFHKLKEWIKFMRKSLEDASLWLATSKGRKGRGYYWNQVAASGSKYSMSHERAVQMSAG